MPVSIPGNLTYINQNAPYSSIVNQNALPKISQIDQQVFLERLQKVEATRALEENKAISPDKENPPHQPPKQEQESQEQSTTQGDADTRYQKDKDKEHCYHGHYYSDSELERAVENTEELEQLVDPHVLDITI
ncbi:hypothetical protein NHP190012_06900 [Helicobacter sp. NHP19-012]|uniref:Uncharacterized protein n=1 Tax=Helicobacter gastrofelis TaxID=2849642 RepID=A0ABN6IAA6_9HELI|nr:MULTISPECIES: hypothetical protein [unclassified Helicobacter]BCZ19048.1 hypothetical protein NHP190012_06900 [Helicobacter sp. NHP19-012]GMB96601.1 hypothetical protein NHP22001_11900 [Helicobacter sp. NHP22-001]